MGEGTTVTDPPARRHRCPRRPGKTTALRLVLFEDGGRIRVAETRHEQLIWEALSSVAICLAFRSAVALDAVGLASYTRIWDIPGAMANAISMSSDTSMTPLESPAGVSR